MRYLDWSPSRVTPTCIVLIVNQYVLSLFKTDLFEPDSVGNTSETALYNLSNITLNYRAWQLGIRLLTYNWSILHKRLNKLKL